MKQLDKLYTDLRRYAVESSSVLSDNDIDKAIQATVAEFVEREFGYKMGADSWQDKIAVKPSGHVIV